MGKRNTNSQRRRKHGNPVRSLLLSPLTLLAISAIVGYGLIMNGKYREVYEGGVVGKGEIERELGDEMANNSKGNERNNKHVVDGFKLEEISGRYGRNKLRGNVVNKTDLEEGDRGKNIQAGDGLKLETISARHERDKERRKKERHDLHRRVTKRVKSERQTSGDGGRDVVNHDEQRKPAPQTTVQPPVQEANNKQATKLLNNQLKQDDKKKGVNKNAKESIPDGARTTGKLDEFRGSDGGSVDGMIRGQNVTRVSYTLYKVMRLFGFVGLTDSPAGAHAEWMVDLVRRLAYDVPLFTYKAVDDAKGLERCRDKVGSVIDGEYFEGNVERNVPGGTDVLFHWTELDGGERDPRGRGYMEHMARVMRVAKKGGFGYLVFGQFPRLNGPSPVFRKGKWKFVGNEEEEPFLLNEHVRGVVPTASGGKAYMLYLTFYSLRSIPMESIEQMDVDAARIS